MDDGCLGGEAQALLQCHAPAAATTTKREAAVSATAITGVVDSAVATQVADPTAATAAAAKATARAAVSAAVTATPAIAIRTTRVQANVGRLRAHPCLQRGGDPACMHASRMTRLQNCRRSPHGARTMRT